MSKVPEEPGRRSDPLFGKGALAALLLWGLIVLAFSAGGLADVTNLWWLATLFGLAAPVAIIAIYVLVSCRRSPDNAERELLEALREHGSLTPVSAAMATSLTVSEATKMLEEWTEPGYLNATTHDGARTYTPRGEDRVSISSGDSNGTLAENEAGLEDSGSSRDLFTDRELSVLRLLADGRANKEISRTLFIAEGTVKAHVASVYRKLGVHSRAAAVARAKDSNLLE